MDWQKLITGIPAEKAVTAAWLKRARQGALTRDENISNHFCVYFAAYDTNRKMVFLGHHKKSGLWLFNGGHMDKGEIPDETLVREIREEWGMDMKAEKIGSPKLLTITNISKYHPIPCRQHFDMWYFVNVNSEVFHPNPEKLAEEFFENRWLTVEAAKEFVTDRNTLTAIRKMFS